MVRGPMMGAVTDQVVEQPGERDISRFLAPLLAQRFIGAQLSAILADLFLCVFAGAAPFFDLLRDAAQQAAR
jgi:hypothetical protein